MTRKVHIGTVAVMALVVFSSIYAALRVDILRDGYVMTNSVLGIVMLAFDFIMMLCVVFGSYRDARLTRAFELMIVTAYLSNLCSVFIFETYGMAEYAELIHGLNAEHCRHRSCRSFKSPEAGIIRASRTAIPTAISRSRSSLSPPSPESRISFSPRRKSAGVCRRHRICSPA